jgi:putative addiction module killer protein
LAVFELRETLVFSAWLDNLRDERAKARIVDRLVRLAAGHYGDAAPVGEGVTELRIHHGPGYRVYTARQGRAVVVLLCGGDKDTQQRDIARAHELAKEL